MDLILKRWKQFSDDDIAITLNGGYGQVLKNQRLEELRQIIQYAESKKRDKFWTKTEP